MKLNLLIILLFSYSFSSAQDWDVPKISKNDWDINVPNKLDKKRRNILLISEASVYGLALVGLNELWYSNYPRSSFHFVNDNQEWLQMDKLGHLTTSYYAGVAGISAYQWTGMKESNAVWYGGMTGTFFLTIIEILDGTSDQWGASAGDLIANTAGSFLAIGQHLAWDEQRIQLKYSYRPSRWAVDNPSQLGSNHLERFFKDYNGQTYWMTFNIKSLFSIEDYNFPDWLSVAVGHSGNKMTSPYQPVDGVGKAWYPKRKRQFLLSLDVDLNKVKTNNKTLNSILHTFGFLKFPMPTIELSNNKFYFHSLYY
tara:strand:+ start:705 stop:1637 length:933 start_codon:yes stop_codon:yes gene_type:complete